MTTTHTLLRLLTLAGIGPVLATSALAQDSLYYYGGVGAGLSRAKLNEERMTSDKLVPGVSVSSVNRDARDTGYKLFGGVQLDRHLGIEAGVFRLGEFSFNSTTVPAGSLNGRIKVEGLNLDLVGTLPLTEHLSALARIGGTYARTRDSFSSTGAVNVGNPSPSQRAGNYKAGLGLQYSLGSSLILRSEIERYRIDDAVGHRSNVDLVSLSLVFPFGRSMAPAPRPLMTAMAAPAPMPAPPPVVVAPPPAPVVVAAPLPPERRRVSFSAESLFSFGKSALRPEGAAALDKLARELSGTQYDSIMVEGHTDRLGSTAFNEKLSQQRADAVKRYLVETGPIDAVKVQATAKGETMPVTKPEDCKGERETPKLVQCLQPDRRVVVEVVGTR